MILYVCNLIINYNTMWKLDIDFKKVDEFSIFEIKEPTYTLKFLFIKCFDWFNRLELVTKNWQVEPDLLLFIKWLKNNEFLYSTLFDVSFWWTFSDEDYYYEKHTQLLYEILSDIDLFLEESTL